MNEATPAVTNYTAITAQLLAAAEPFESLTETAFSATPATRWKAIDAAEKAAKGIADIVPHTISIKLADHLMAVRSANAAEKPSDVALASIEGFRTLVSAVPGSPAIPVDVSLLDYAGFRYDADAQAASTSASARHSLCVSGPTCWAPSFCARRMGGPLLCTR
tara:strand:+ start:1047 stop:1535 length:489 start_codon:yes stop_codon:yes gene_type:complete